MASMRCSADSPLSRPAITVQSLSKFAPPHIPDDVIFDILLRLPARSIIRFKSVCKAWLAMLSSRRFVDAHLEFSKVRPSMLIVPGEFSRRTAFQFQVGYYRYNGGDVAEVLHNERIAADERTCCGGQVQFSKPLHCDGLILVSTYDQITVCNPATREFLTLPKASAGVGFGRDPCTSRYKVASVFYERGVMDGRTIWILKLEVLTLGSNVWRRIADPPDLNVRISSVHVRGFIYWTTVRRENNHPKVLAGFSLADETFSETPYPPCIERGYVHFAELEGGLCSAVVSLTCEAAKVWTYNGTEKATWTLRFTVQLSQETITTTGVWHNYLAPPKLTFHGKDILIRGGHKLYRYSTETGEMKKVDVAVEDLRYYHPENNSDKLFSGDKVSFHIVKYAESLVPIREDMTVR
ncbi:unnamed protein product [Urochloa decumbens]|uniref:F-box domain-containing protein n=1 Tax=Urochloa decumbens TaxID=240449 RepID=A0ABC9DBG3_9POAL